LATVALRDLLAQDAVVDDGDNVVTVGSAAESIVNHHVVSFERRDGLRRLVFVGEWEVDPAAQYDISRDRETVVEQVAA
jgi:hypothetical protein